MVAHSSENLDCVFPTFPRPGVSNHQLLEFLISTNVFCIEEDLRHGPFACVGLKLLSSMWIFIKAHINVWDTQLLKTALGAHAMRTTQY